MIEPRVPSGTRDLLPAQAIARDRLLSVFRSTFEGHGFVPIDTPVLERREVLYAKGGDEIQRQIYEVAQRGQRLEDSDLALRFDLTVPLARYMAAHVSDVGVPFKRYHIGLVFRGERAQRGRYREFYQCDFDIVGSRSVVADAEVAEIIHDGLRAAGIPAFTVRLNDRRVLDGLLAHFGLLAHRSAVLRVLDKWDKVGRDGVARELAALRGADNQPLVPHDVAEQLLQQLDQLRKNDNASVLAALRELLAGHETASQGLTRLEEVLALLEAAELDGATFRIDPSLARGLDYYTGIIFETTVDGYESFGAVAAGGRYDDLAGLFTSIELPGVGASFGVDRLLALMAEAGWLQPQAATAPVLLVNFPGGDVRVYFRLAHRLRQAGIGCEIFPDPRPLRDQLGYASSRGYRFALIIGPDELAQGTFALRNLQTRQQQRDLPLSELVDRVRAALAEGNRLRTDPAERGGGKNG